MPSWTEDDKKAMFNAYDGVSDAAYYGSSEVPIYGHFMNNYQALGMLSGDVESSNPVFLCNEEDVSGIDHSKTLTINDEVWKVREVKPDGSGFIAIILSK